MKKYSSIVSHQPVLGLDVAQASFVAALRVDATRILIASFPNHKGGFRSLRTWLRQHFAGGVRAGLEATGVYGQALTQALHAEGHLVHVLNPARVAAYARSNGQRNKTDPADARMIAAYVAAHELPAWVPPPPEQLTLQHYTRLRQQLGEQRQQLRNQLHSAPAATRDVLHRLIANFEAELAGVERSIKEHLAQHPALAKAVQRLCTVPGIAERTATCVLAELPAITQDSDPRALSAWCGLVPARFQSGQTEHRSHLSRRGNARLRLALLMPALVAKRYNPLLRAFAERLAKNGKRPGAILGAVAHKLLRILIGMLRHDRDFDPNWIALKN